MTLKLGIIIFHIHNLRDIVMPSPPCILKYLRQIESEYVRKFIISCYTCSWLTFIKYGVSVLFLTKAVFTYVVKARFEVVLLRKRFQSAVVVCILFELNKYRQVFSKMLYTFDQLVDSELT